MPAKKKTVATKGKKKVVAKKRVSTKEPTTIIKRKKKVTRTRADRQKARAGRKRGEAKGDAKAKVRSAKSADEAKLIEKVAALLKKGKSVKEIAEIIGVSFSKAKRLAMSAQMKPKDRVVGNTAEVGATIVKLRKEGVSWPQIRVRTGLGGGTVRRLYEESSGKDWRDSGTAKSTAKRTGGRKKATTKRDRTRPAKGTAKKVRKGRTRKSTGEALAEANEAATKSPRGKKAGRPKGRRALRDHNATLLRDTIWDSDSPTAEVKAALKGKTITIEREGLRSQDVKVKAVKDVKVTDRMGRMVEFTDTDGKSRFVATREITGIR